MWIGQVAWSTVAREARWSVELFASLDAPRMKSKHDMVPIGELVAERRETLVPSRWPDFPFAYVGLENVAGQSGLLDGFARKLGRDVQSASGVFHAGDVLYGRLRPYLNKVYLADAVVNGICSGEFFVLVPNLGMVRPLFMREVLSSTYVADAVKGMQFGSSLPRLQLSDLLKLEVPVPSLDEQYAIEVRLRAARQVLFENINICKTGGRQIRRAFEMGLQDGFANEIHFSPFLREEFESSGLPSDYAAKVKGRRSIPKSLYD